MTDQLRDYLSFVRPWDGDDIKVVTHTYMDRQTGEIKLAKRGFTTLDAAASFMYWKDGAGEDVWFSYQRFGRNPAVEEMVDRRGQVSYKKPFRDARHVEQLWCFHTDMDVKPGAYATLQDAVDAIFDFCARIALPPPSMMVCSGYGLHSYWRVEAPMTQQQWLPLASALRNAQVQHGILADHGVTVDSARILRPAGLHNHKVPTVNAPTYIIPGSSQQVYPLAWFADPLKPFSGPQLATVAGVSTGRVAQRATPSVGGINSHFTGGMQAGGIVDLLDIANSCAVIWDEFDTHGATADEPLWNLIATACVFDKTPWDTFEKMSDGYHKYDPVEARTKLADKEMRQQQGTLGWPACSAFHNLGGAVASKCMACPHFAAQKSPLNLTSRPKPTPGALPGTDPDLPAGYWQNPDGAIWTQIPDKDTKAPIDVCVLNYVVRDGFVEDATNNLIFLSTSSHGKAMAVRITKEKAADIRGELHAHGLFTQEIDAPRLGRFFMAWATHLRTAGKIERYSAMGWNGSSFVHGDTLYSNGAAQKAILGDQASEKVWGIKGDPDPWMALRDVILRHGHVGLQCLLAVGFAAPLVAMSGRAAVLLTPFSTASGTGKTTALCCSVATWGNYIYGSMATNDTDNYVAKKLGMAPNFPAVWDEIPLDEKVLAGVVRLAFQLGQGRDKGRLHATTSINEGGNFQTMMVAASNMSLAEKITMHNNKSNAGMMRAFEIRIGKILSRSTVDPEEYRDALKSNYGHTGAKFAAYLAANYEDCLQVVRSFIDLYRKKFNEDESYRFWVTTIATIMAGAYLARHIGLVDFDLKAMGTYLMEEAQHIDTLGKAEVEDMTSANYDIGELLGMTQGSGKVLFTDTINIAAGPPQQIKSVHGQTINEIAKMPDAWAQRSGAPNMLRVRKREFVKWLMEKGYSPRQVIAKLVANHGATQGRGAIGVGLMGWPNASVRAQVIDIPMAQFA